MKITVVDDDRDSLKTTCALIRGDFPGHRVTGFDDLFKATHLSCDLLLIDVSSVAPMMMGDVSHAWSPIAKFYEMHPGAVIVIMSAMSQNAIRDLIDDLEQFGNVPRAQCFVGGFMWEDIKRALEPHLTK